MEVLYDTFQIQPLINSEVLMDVETTQNRLFSTNFMYSTSSNLGEEKKFKKKENG